MNFEVQGLIAPDAGKFKIGMCLFTNFYLFNELTYNFSISVTMNCPDDLEKYCENVI